MAFSTVKRKQITNRNRNHDIVRCATVSVDTDGARDISPTQALSTLRIHCASYLSYERVCTVCAVYWLNISNSHSQSFSDACSSNTQ